MQGKVALVSGGGSGHEPLHGGFVGRGMLDAACPGEVFTSPVPDQMLAATKAVDGGAGVVHIVKNYTGDVMNFKLAAEDAADEGIDVESVLIDDDVAVQDSLYTAGRRGVGATVLAEKIAGAAAERGDDLAAVAGVARRVNERSRSFGVALSSCTPPAAGQADLRPARRARWRSASASTASRAGGASRSAPPREIAGDDGRGGAQRPRSRPTGTQVLPFVNGMGGTPQIELYLLYGEVERALRERRPRAGAQPGRQLHHVARDGRRVADAARARRRADRAVGCSGAHRRAALGGVTASDHARPPWSSAPSPPGWRETAAVVRGGGRPPDPARRRDRRRRPRDQHEPRLRRRRARRWPAQDGGAAARASS